MKVGDKINCKVCGEEFVIQPNKTTQTKCDKCKFLRSERGYTRTIKNGKPWHRGLHDR